ncbi:4'-phosphopantetheinyl transferase superfamily protein [Undibacterium sp. LX40W]|uniref:4'-phosphopantetheinyl transferase superfamily protein n=1 Tax=Undibacterium nitidum TaxID=2762298 RepID=A0A923HK74_9BURK|nr:MULTISPECIES: 4'-phosphopantetheinyl transferase superfamily protein [Undibacterium]MBC3880909.1 4'-phosphopantetheinyl transferase superfamily protein [Undibacterium nitidum]MBC3890358.1 4'-phosphopantetheinyl transferase superfamily protein [Undibacterium sp. LX40W]
MKIYLAHLSALSTLPQLRKDAICQCLSVAEALRYQRFLRPERAQQFLLGRYLLRHQLSSLLGIPAVEVPLSERPNNAPLLDLKGLPPIGFSISHSQQWVACAIAKDAKLGLDIEVIDPQRDVLALAEHSFHHAQIAELLAKSQQDQIEYFYQCWTAKEAQIKLSAACQELQHLRYSRYPELAIAVCSDTAIACAPEILEVVL